MKKSYTTGSLPRGSKFVLGTLFGFSLCLFIQHEDTQTKNTHTLAHQVQEEPRHPTSVHATSSIMKYGSPSPNYIRERESYVLNYDARSKNPFWVYEYITPACLEGQAMRSNFKNDPSIPAHHSARLEDYKATGLDRGHLAAAGNNKSSQTRMDETFLMSVISPQVGVGFNRDSWKQLEEKIRAIALRNIGVHVITGPLWLPENGIVKYQVIGNGISVPTHFFKVILIEKTDGSLEPRAWILPNQAIRRDVQLDAFLTTTSYVEKVSGLTFFPKLPKLNKQ